MGRTRVQEENEMKLFGIKGGHGHITAYSTTIGSREAREAGFLNPDGSSKILKKTVDPEHHKIIIEIDAEAETEKN